jgi:hypothetical protein
MTVPRMQRLRLAARRRFDERRGGPCCLFGFSDSARLDGAADGALCCCSWCAWRRCRDVAIQRAVGIS